MVFQYPTDDLFWCFCVFLTGCQPELGPIGTIFMILLVPLSTAIPVVYVVCVYIPHMKTFFLSLLIPVVYMWMIVYSSMYLYLYSSNDI